MTIHDHFEGSAHCVECGGKCQLTGDERKVTTLVRYICETAAFTGRASLGGLVDHALRDLDVDPHRFMARARQTCVKG